MSEPDAVTQLQALDDMGKLLGRMQGHVAVTHIRLATGESAVSSLELLRQQLAALDELAVVALGGDVEREEGE